LVGKLDTLVWDQLDAKSTIADCDDAKRIAGTALDVSMLLQQRFFLDDTAISALRYEIAHIIGQSGAF
jgi:hypothetical protein